ncbi:uncharacterized protein LOC100367568 [Saccoglossus kowalevskii]|uniref:Uncharacterized protein LOC100367568 n=1 Tax=Saccoglossus kowalevskii TaxID=10224 RepID=A0ABM0GP85_SACKO|nr:PREDICTED: uncharacterized protein LOC100367568 [Saccoglossus kowalevskii]
MLCNHILFAIAVVTTTQAIDPRLLRREPTEQVPTRDVKITHDELVTNLEVFTGRFNEMEQRLEDSLIMNVELEKRIQYQESQIIDLDDTIHELSRLKSKLREAERNIGDLGKRLSEGCSCVGGSNEGVDENTERGPPDDDWVVNLDREQISNMRADINKEMAERNRNNAGSLQENRAVNLDNNVLREFSHTLAEMIASRTMENGRNEGLFRPIGDDSTTSESAEENSMIRTTLAASVDGRPRPQKPRPGAGFPFPARHIAKRAVTEEEAVMELENVLVDVLRSAKKKVAFSSIRTEPLMGTDGGAQAIAFQKNQANKGKNFDRSSGMFVCTIPGIYYFSYTMRSYDKMHIGVALMKNDDAVVAMTTDASDRKVMQTQSTMLSLDIGDQVWLLLGPSDNFAIYGNDFNYNTFNGHILYPNYIS